MRPFLFLLVACFYLCCFPSAFSQLVLNEGSNKNYLSIADEDGDHPDWVELYNAGTDTVFLLGYSLSDEQDEPDKWTFPNVFLPPGEFLLVFCSGKDRQPLDGFVPVAYEANYTPQVGWNTHDFSQPLVWGGTSDLLINVCSYRSAGYTVNSVFRQTATPYLSSVFAFQDGSDAICQAKYGFTSNLRPNLRVNGIQIGDGNVQNSPFDYPAPYGNWYFAARHQFLIPASELQAAGLSPGPLASLAFDVAETDPNTTYDYLDFSIKLVNGTELSSSFLPLDTIGRLHTNFKISSAGETIYLFSPGQQLLSSLTVQAPQPDNSNGLLPNGSGNAVSFVKASPEASNAGSAIFSAILSPPLINTPSGFYDQLLTVSLTNPNGPGTVIRYTLNGEDPKPGSPLYTGTPIQVYYSSALKARVFGANSLPSEAAVASYLIGVEHSTPVLSVVTSPQNLYGPTGIFDNWPLDWERAAHAEYFDSTQQLIFSQRTGMQIDGGAGGSRSHPQHSFRLELDDPVLGASPVQYPLIPNRPQRGEYNRIYLRNGSNYYLQLPHKDAAHVQGMGAETFNYYSAWRPVSVYINGSYFGLYELREKIDAAFFETYDQADPGTMDLLSLSFWNGSVLRAVEGKVSNFYDSYAQFQGLDAADTDFWTQADAHFDMTWYADYIIAETYAGNVDWPHNNIRFYRSDATGFRWRFCLIDLEGGFNPLGFSSAQDDHIAYVLGADPNNPFINIFLKSIQNQRFRRYFINRYADLMNTSYQYERLSAIENDMFEQTVVEMPRQFMRWGDPNNVGGQMDNFVNNHEIFQSQLNIRTPLVRNHIQQNFGLNKKVQVLLDVYPPEAGKIQISTIIPESLPWTGIYFHGNPVRLTAIPNPGYEFSHWEPNAVLNQPNTQASFEVDIHSSTQFVAVFEADPLSAGERSEGQLHIYPNPSTGHFTIGLPDSWPLHEPLDIQVTDLPGRTVCHLREQPGGRAVQLDLQHCAPGTYLVLVRCGQRQARELLVVE